MHGDLSDDVGEDGDAGQIDRASPAEAPFQELGHGEHVGAHVERDEDPAQHQQDERGQPLEMPDCQALGSAGASQTEEVLSVDVGDEERRSDGEPAHAAASQEIFGGGPFPAREIEADAEDDQEIRADDRQVQRRQSPVSDGGHGPLL